MQIGQTYEQQYFVGRNIGFAERKNKISFSNGGRYRMYYDI